MDQKKKLWETPVSLWSLKKAGLLNHKTKKA